MGCRQTARVAFAAMVALQCGGALSAQTAAGPLNVGTPKDGVEIGREAGAVGERRPALAHFKTHTERNLFRVHVPSDWRELPDGDAVVFAPAGGYGEAGGQMVFTHGVEIGLAPRAWDDLRLATRALIDLLASDNPSLRQLSDLDRSSLGGQPAVCAVLSNASEVTGQEERMEIVTTLFRDRRLFYALVVAPRRTFAGYEPTFRQVISSIAIIE